MSILYGDGLPIDNRFEFWDDFLFDSEPSVWVYDTPASYVRPTTEARDHRYVPDLPGVPDEDTTFWMPAGGIAGSSRPNPKSATRAVPAIPAKFARNGMDPGVKIMINSTGLAVAGLTAIEIMKAVVPPAAEVIRWTGPVHQETDVDAGDQDYDGKEVSDEPEQSFNLLEQKLEGKGRYVVGVYTRRGKLLISFALEDVGEEELQRIQASMTPRTGRYHVRLSAQGATNGVGRAAPRRGKYGGRVQ